MSFLKDLYTSEEIFSYIFNKTLGEVKGELATSLLVENFEFVKPLYDKYEMLPNVQQHSIAVAVVSLYLALTQGRDTKEHWMNILENLPDNADKPVRQRRLVGKLTRSALLHDIAKTWSIKNKKMELAGSLCHGKEGERILRNENLGFDAKVAGWHLIRPFINGVRMSAPAKIVNLADKMVEQTTFMHVEERFVALRERYPQKTGYLNEDTILKYKEFLNEFNLPNLNSDMEFINSNLFTKIISINDVSCLL